jgi:deazaflavin-dependent oxidoreductase (nitroreductase family)
MTETETTTQATTESTEGGWDETAWEEALIADLRANGGRVSQGPLKGHPIIVLYSTGAKTGERRRSVLTISRDGDAYVVAGTAGGSPTTPSWVANLEAHPDVEFEFGDTTYHGRAEVIREGSERDRLWVQHVEALPHFADYPEQTGRVIPLARIVPSAG